MWMAGIRPATTMEGGFDASRPGKWPERNVLPRIEAAVTWFIENRNRLKEVTPRTLRQIAELYRIQEIDDRDRLLRGKSLRPRSGNRSSPTDPCVGALIAEIGGPAAHVRPDA